MSSLENRCLFFIPFLLWMAAALFIGSYFAPEKQLPESVIKFRIEQIPILKTKASDYYRRIPAYQNLNSDENLTKNAGLVNYDLLAKNCRFNELRHDRILQNHKILLDKCLDENKIYRRDRLRTFGQQEVLELAASGLSVQRSKDNPDLYELRLQFFDQNLATKIANRYVESYQKFLEERTHSLIVRLGGANPGYQPDVFNIVPTGFELAIEEPAKPIELQLGRNEKHQTLICAFGSALAGLLIAFPYSWLFQRFPKYVFGITLGTLSGATAACALSLLFPTVYESSATFRCSIPPLVVSPSSNKATITMLNENDDYDIADTFHLYNGVESTLDSNNLYQLSIFEPYEDQENSVSGVTYEESVNEFVLESLSVVPDEDDSSIVHDSFFCENTNDGETIVSNMIDTYFADMRMQFNRDLPYLSSNPITSSIPFEREYEVLSHPSTKKAFPYLSLFMTVAGAVMGLGISALAIFTHALVSHGESSHPPSDSPSSDNLEE